MDLSIVIVNWNTRELLSRCLRLIYGTITDLAFEVFVVDNASQDKSAAMVRASFPKVHLLENRRNVGFARANNQAIRESRGRYILLLNPDTFVEEGTVERMVDFLDAHLDVGAAGCRLKYPGGEYQLSCTSFPTLLTEFFLLTHLDRLFLHSPIFGRYSMSYCSFDRVCEVDVVQGAFMLVRRQAIEKVGLLDESFFMYSEEMDWCYRIKQGGWKVCYVPSTEATHVGGSSTAQARAEMVLELYRSRVRFFRKHYGFLRAYLLRLLFVGASVSRIIFFPIKYVFQREAREETRQKWAGYWKLLWAMASL